jgi:hypothetical protein
MKPIRALPRVFADQYDGNALRFGPNWRTVQKLEVFFVYLQAEFDEVVLHRYRSAGSASKFNYFLPATALVEAFFVVRPPQFSYFFVTAPFVRTLFLIVTGANSLRHCRALRSEGEDDQRDAEVKNCFPHGTPLKLLTIVGNDTPDTPGSTSLGQGSQLFIVRGRARVEPRVSEISGRVQVDASIAGGVG